MLAERRLELYFAENPPHFFDEMAKSAVILSPENFHNAKNLLGREFDQILFDGRTSLNLDALAIAAGTLRAGGRLLLWLDKKPHVDPDSLRWSGAEQAVETPNFYAHFNRLLQVYGCDNGIQAQNNQSVSTQKTNIASTATAEQQQIIRQILQADSDIFILTAKRGRGKSALAGLLAKELRNSAQYHKQPFNVYLTAPNKSAVETLQLFAGEKITFIAPDELCRRIGQNARQFSPDWLLIDEAAMIPLELLFQLTSTFKHILCCTTIHSYEGTGRGFLLKFLPNLHRSFQQFELIRPLRWAENDKLEKFIEELLMLEAEDRLIQPTYSIKSAVKIRQISQNELVEHITDFYGLLTLAHYRTSPLDLRRLFDAVKQHFLIAEWERYLLAGVWALEEGGFSDKALIRSICRGERRPKGNLVAQSLAFNCNLPEACALKSLRISRIAVQPDWQGRGLGLQLVEKLAQTAQADFLSVSFGYNEELDHFWQKCGFILVNIGEYKEATSGCYSAIALRPLTAAGEDLVKRAQQYFRRNLAFTFHPLRDKLSVEKSSAEKITQLNGQDFGILENFADYHRTFYSSQGAIYRLFIRLGADTSPMLDKLFNSRTIERTKGKKYWLKQCRQEVKRLLKLLEKESPDEK